MPLTAFEGPAGSGKTYSLIEEAKQLLANTALSAHEQVLAITFAHGSRRRLHQKLAADPAFRSRFHCCTLDSFALNLLIRWRDFARSLGLTITATEFDQTCHCAAVLLGNLEIKAWVSRSFPIVIVDESQDLNEARLALVSKLASGSHVFAAADEFQCLIDGQDTSHVKAWLHSAESLTELTGSKRTTCNVLLDAADATRDSGQLNFANAGFSVLALPGAQAESRVARLLEEALARRETVALIAHSLKDPWVKEIVAKLVTGFAVKSSGRSFRPISLLQPVPPEIAADECARVVFGDLNQVGIDDAVGILRGQTPTDRTRWMAAVGDAVQTMKSVRGVTTINRADFQATAFRIRRLQDGFGYGGGRRPELLTVHGAKNREFDRVILLWSPYSMVALSPANRRRLFYNAITRAKLRCDVVVPNDEALTFSPLGNRDDIVFVNKPRRPRKRKGKNRAWA